jgi:hypothetical protein
MTNTHEDTELKNEIADIIKDQLAPLTYDNMFPEHQEMVDGILTLIRSREQTAELRGRIDEVKKPLLEYHKNELKGLRYDFYFVLRNRLDELQATKPEKGAEQ